MLFVHFIHSLVTDCLTHLKDGDDESATINISDAIECVYDIRFHEAPICFSLSRVYSRGHEEIIASLHKSYSYLSEEVLLKCVRVHTSYVNMYPPPNVVTQTQKRFWSEHESASAEFLQQARKNYLVFFDPLVTCVVMSQLISSTSMSIKPTEKMIQSRPLFQLDKTSEFNIKSAAILLGKWELSKEHPLEVCPFYDGGKLQLTYPFPLFPSENEETCVMPLAVMLLFVERLGADGKLQQEEMILNPWNVILNDQDIEWKTEWDPLNKFDVQEVIIDTLFHADISPPSLLMKYSTSLEKNIYLCWGHGGNVSHPSLPSIGQFVDHFCNTHIICTDIPTGRIPVAPNAAVFTRKHMVDIIRATAESHICHSLVRREETEHLPANASISIIPSPSGEEVIMYISITYKLGASFKTSHVAILSDNPEAFQTMLASHWDTVHNWVDDTYFFQYALTVARAITSFTTNLPPIPVGRVFFHDHVLTHSVEKKQWKLGGCGCFHCKVTRHEELVCL